MSIISRINFPDWALKIVFSHFAQKASSFFRTKTATMKTSRHCFAERFFPFDDVNPTKESNFADDEHISFLNQHFLMS
jgi:hypothetical protein